jgi:hypothetical protein
LTVQPTGTESHFDASIKLDGVSWRFSFYTNTTDGGWYYDVLNDDGIGVRGAGLATGVDLLHTHRYLELPPGPLWIEDKGLDGEDPDLTAFADGRAALYYLESS